MALTAGFQTVLLMLLYLALLIGVRYFRRERLVNYLLYGVSFILLSYLVISHNFDRAMVNKVSYFYIFLTALLLPDILSPNIAATLFALYYFHLMEQEGANQYAVQANIIGLFITSVSSSLIFNLIKKLYSERDRYKQLSNSDPLTRLYNFNYILEEGNKLLKKGKSLSVLLIDLNRFKEINDTYGHMKGNRVLKQIASLIQVNSASLNSIVGRLGGDEFVIILKDAERGEVVKLRKRLNRAMKKHLFYVDPEIDPVRLSFSIGTAYSSDRGTNSMEKIISVADLNMYYHKYEHKKTAAYTNINPPSLSSSANHLLEVLAEKDMYTFVHSEYVAYYAGLLAERLNLDARKVSDIFTAGWFHDIGKLLISNDILRKSSRVNDSEYEIIKHHVTDGIKLLEKCRFNSTILNGIKYHHEKWDGSGYPYGLKGEEIPIEGRILKLCDTYSAMIVKRVYRKTFTNLMAAEEIKRGIGRDFDPNLVFIFLEIILDDSLNISKNKLPSKIV